MLKRSLLDKFVLRRTRASSQNVLPSKVIRRRTFHHFMNVIDIRRNLITYEVKFVCAVFITLLLNFQVPPAVKALYANPLPDVFQVSPVSRSLLTASEVVERWRREEERERRVLTSPRKPAFTNDQNEVRSTQCVCCVAHVIELVST